METVIMVGMFVVCLVLVHTLGYRSGKKQVTKINTLCSHPDLWKELCDKNYILHRLEKRVFHLRKANRFFREERGRLRSRLGEYVPCKKCGAEIGQMCTGRAGGHDETHPERWQDAYKLAENGNVADWYERIKNEKQ